VQYLLLAYYTYKLARQPLAAAALAEVPGHGALVKAFDVLTDPVQKAVALTKTTLENGVAGVMEKFGYKVTGAVSEATTTGAARATGPATTAGVFSQLKQEAVQALYDFVKNALPGLEQTLFEVDAAGQVAGFSQNVLAIYNFVATAFLVYQTLQILLHIVFRCTEDELKLGIDRKVGNCSYVGDYCATDSIIGCIETRDSFCCYKTPLARIISERLRRQGVGGGYGGAKHPNCGGFSAAELASANWSRIDLSEWEARLAQAGILPATPEQAEARWGMGASRAALATGQTAQGPDGEISKPAYVEERLGVRSGAITEGRETLAGQQVCYSDPELMPWYEDQTSPPAPPSCRSLAADLYFGAYMTSLTTIRFDLKTGTWQPSTPTDAAAYDVRVPVVDAGQACQPSAAFGWTAAQWQGANVPGKFDASACYHLLQPPTCENGLVGIAQIQDNCSSGDNLLKYGAQYTFQYEVCQAGGGAGGPGECFAPVP
jgi:hypothetical protein